MGITTRDMSDKHEAHIAAVLSGRVTPGSGSQWNDQMDGKQPEGEQYVFAWDGKATLGLSVGVTRAMWAKARQQAQGLIPLLPIRFYANSRLTEVDADLVVLDLEVLASLQHDANELHRIRERGCLTGTHDFVHPHLTTCSVCGASAWDQPGAES
jgi:hypothetical protein